MAAVGCACRWRCLWAGTTLASSTPSTTATAVVIVVGARLRTSGCLHEQLAQLHEHALRAAAHGALVLDDVWVRALDEKSHT